MIATAIHTSARVGFQRPEGNLLADVNVMYSSFFSKGRQVLESLLPSKISSDLRLPKSRKVSSECENGLGPTSESRMQISVLFRTNQSAELAVDIALSALCTVLKRIFGIF